VGGVEFREIKYAYKQLSNHSSDIILMCGFQNFPTKIKDVKLNKIIKLKKYFKSIMGFADHTDAEQKNLAFGIPLMAYSLGASVIEKHITKNREKKGNDYYSSLNPNEFSEFVTFLKTCQKAFGNSKEWQLSKAEIKYKKFTSKFAVASKDIKKGEKITKNNVIFKRTNQIGISQNDFALFTGKKISKDKLYDEMIYPKEIK
jgi:sialic acid synthase SpsE